MKSRELILQRIQLAQPDLHPLPPNHSSPDDGKNLIADFERALRSIGGMVHQVNNKQEALKQLKELFPEGRIVHIDKPDTDEKLHHDTVPHTLDDVKLAILSTPLGVSENGAVWITDHECKVRALPFIAENLAILIHANAIVGNLHEAYKKTQDAEYDFGVWIAGPSKTADIEQSLVLGAHGSRSMHVFILP